ncbi:putative ATP-dependent zinc protease [Adhaeretor mobilis]|uniref:Retropepsin-like aspartic endopeptidase domain-containing protein n=1 Tax=Adhaeretor mobilis TaxID=1930276 RepID=A0A517N205_9BACT|nr:RimK/LysX family protein [Adhaeretor mobilis]QDT01048.1 hypothetical protein HG15A2_43900 [Adhaeretor mobilis]
MSDFKRQTAVVFALGASIIAAAIFVLSLDLDDVQSTKVSAEDLRVLGPTVNVALLDFEVTEDPMLFNSRVDTGAKTCSLHADSWSIEDGSEVMEENLGKKIRFRVENRTGESLWLERIIEEVAIVRTSEREEKRYKIPMTLLCEGVERTVLVSLNDRSAMSYAMLLGRNYLNGMFLVDVTGADVEDELLAGGGAQQSRKDAN